MDGSLAERLRRPDPHPAGPPEGGEVIVQRVTPGRDPGRPPRPAGDGRGLGAPTRQGTLRPPMEKFVIEGGVPLSGTIVPAGNKNGALPILAACLLTDDEVILRNVPRIRDVEAMTLLLEQLGARVQWLGPGDISIDSSSVDSWEVDR